MRRGTPRATYKNIRKQNAIIKNETKNIQKYTKYHNRAKIITDGTAKTMGNGAQDRAKSK